VSIGKIFGKIELPARPGAPLIVTFLPRVATVPRATASGSCRQINAVNVDKHDWRCGIEAPTLWPFHRRNLFQEIVE
jgi:hypothetical protein